MSWSVSTGLGAKSLAPASMHRWRSPGITLPVTAMMGSDLNRSNDRMVRMVTYPSMVGIMMSISTRSMSGFASSEARAWAPLSARVTAMMDALMRGMLRKEG